MLAKITPFRHALLQHVTNKLLPQYKIYCALEQAHPNIKAEIAPHKAHTLIKWQRWTRFMKVRYY